MDGDALDGAGLGDICVWYELWLGMFSRTGS